MEEKIITMLLEMNQRFDKLEQKMEVSNQELLQDMKELRQEVGERFDDFEKKVDQKFVEFEKKVDQKFVEFEKKVNQKFDSFEKKVLGQHFLFENEYGIKIDAIFDAVTLELDKNLEKSEKIGKLEGRMNRNEVAVFNHEKRISKLEFSH